MISTVERIKYQSQIDTYHQTNTPSVIRRDGTKRGIDIQRIRNVVKWACEGLEVSGIKLEAGLTTRLKDGISTREIQDNLINVALNDCTIEEPDWRYVAGRLGVWSLWKDVKVSRGYGYGVGNYRRLVHSFTEKRIYDTRLLTYTDDELDEAGSWIVPERDKGYDHAGFVSLRKRYLLPDELIQEMYLSISLLLALPEILPRERMKYAKRFYDLISERKISLATPLLANLRVPKGNLSSCFIIQSDDTLESIFQQVTNIAKISKGGGGVGINISKIRASGSWLKGRENKSKGVVPWIKIINDTIVAVDQGGVRTGAATVSIDTWHLDVEDFLELQTESGDIRKKAHDVMCQLVVSDEFMRRVEDEKEWTLLDPYEVKTKLGLDLADMWGDEFTKAYQLIEEQALNTTIKLYKKVDARSLFKQIMKVQVETGLPYLTFKDTLNRANPNKHKGIIPGFNLCVAPETKILTDKGQIEIASLEGQFTNVWNGSEWSNVMIRKTGKNQPLLRVNLSNGESLDCTYYHKFWIQDSYHSKPKQVEARELKEGDKLIKYTLPIVSSPEDIDFPYAYTSGAFSGDGSYGHKTTPEIDLYGEKKDLLSHLVVRNKLRHGFGGYTELDQIAVYDDVKQDRLICRLPLDIPPKFTVPLNGYTVKSRLEWLAGLLDTDGTVCRNGSNESFSITSIHKPFLLEVKLLLQTLGVDAKVVQAYKEMTRLMPDGKGGQKEYKCKESYRLLINSNGLYQLGELGLVTHRLKWQMRKPQREASQFIKVKSIDLTCRISDTYCFHESKRNLGMFNGILTGQCVESASVVSADKWSHVCNLLSVNLAQIDSLPVLAHACEIGVRILDNAIDLTSLPIPEAKAHNDMFRTIGVGAMGLADWLAKRELNYSSLNEISNLFEDFGYYCTRASMNLAKERGVYKAFIGSEWDKGKLINSKSLEEIQSISYSPDRWIQLHQDIALYGIRNSHITAIAPNTSSALVQGCTSSVLPTYSRFYYNNDSKGAVPIAPPFIRQYFWYYQENKNLDQTVVINAISTIQQWIDTGISMELVINLNLGLTAKDIFDLLLLAWDKKCKATYYIRSVQKHDINGGSGGSESCISCAG